MSYINHPLLTTHKVSAASSVLTGTVPLSCATVTSGAQTLAIDLTSLSLADDDFVVLVVWGSHTSPTSSSKFRTPSGWMKLGPEGVGTKPTSASRTPQTSFAKHWDTGSDSATFNLTAYPNAATETMCWTAWKFTGVSKVNPVDYPATHCYDRYFEPIQLVWTPPMFGHGDNPESVILVKGNQDVDVTGLDTSEPFDWSDRSNFYAAPGTDIRSYQWYGSAANYIQYVLMVASQPKAYLQNLMANAEVPYAGTESSDSGLTTSNCSQRDGYDGLGFTHTFFPEIQVPGDLGVAEKFVSAGTSLPGGSGNQVIVRARLAAQQGVTGSSTELWGATLVTPSGELGAAVYAGFQFYSITDKSLSMPDEYQLVGRSYSGIPSEYSLEVVYVHDASTAGTYAFRGYLLNSAEAASFDSGGSAGTWVGREHVFNGLAIGHNVFPEFIPTSAGGQSAGSYGNMLAPICWTFKNSTWATAYWADNFAGETPNLEPVYAYTLARNATDTWGGYQMLSIESYNPTGLLEADGITASAKAADNIKHPDGYVLKTNRWALPYYFATEDALTSTPGKYYCEVTQGRTNTMTVAGVAVCPGGIHMGEVNLFSSIEVPGAIQYTVSGGVKYGQSTMSDDVSGTYATFLTAGDVMGIALDYENAQLSFYINGTLQLTVDLTAFQYDWTTMPAQLAAYSLIATTAALCSKFSFNFTGPFTYTKPTGFTAWDWLNEVV